MLQFVVTVLLLLCAALHALFVYGEMVPVQDGLPQLLLSLLDGHDPEPKGLVVSIVQNAGAYNVIVTCGFILAALLPYLRFLDLGKHGVAIFQGFFCAAALWAGIYGVSLSIYTLVQAVLGAVTLFAVIISCKNSTRNSESMLGNRDD